MARSKTANPVPDGVIDGTPSTAAVRLAVRTVAAMGEQPRYRAGLGPFTREAQMVEATPEQAEALRADLMLAVAEVKE